MGANTRLRCSPRKRLASRFGRLSVVVFLALGTLPLAAQTGPTETTSTAADSGAAALSAFHIHGVVKAGNTLLPGVTITAANTLTGKKSITSTEPDGSYSLELSARGRYVVRVEMIGFTAATLEVLLSPSSPRQQANFSLVLLSRAPKPSEAGAMPSGPAAIMSQDGRGTQRLSLTVDDSALSGATGNGGAEQATLGGLAGLVNSPDATNQSVSVAGTLGNTPGLLGGARTSEELQERIQEMRSQQGWGNTSGDGTLLGAALAGGPFVLRTNHFNFNQPHGMLYYQAGNSALDASSYSLNGQPGTNPAYSSNRFGGLIGGPLVIPHLISDDQTFFFGGYTGTRASTPYVSYSNVPTEAERNGDFSTAGRNGTPVQLICPASAPSSACTPGQLIGSQLPSALIGPAAQGLLNYIPLPNQAGNAYGRNYRFASAADNNTDNLFLRLTHNFGTGGFGPFGGGALSGRPHNNLNFNFNWQHGDNGQLEPFPTTAGTTQANSFNTGLGWAVGKGRWNNIFRVNFNRARTETTNLYAVITNVEALLGITGVSNNPSDWGLPNLSFLGLTGLTDVAPQYRNDATLQFSETAVWNRNKHHVRFGGDFRRLWTTLNSNTDPRGSFTFTGFATGNAFADFLAGLPQATALQYSSTPYYFSISSYDFFAVDDWRVASNFTLQVGIRYEYIAPYTEANNRIVNLDIAPGMAAVVPVLPGQVAPYSGVSSNSLVKPDRNNSAPRVGLAWKVERNTVVRAGYGINYDLSEYGTIITHLAYQPPYAVATTPIASTVGMLTLANGFPAAASNVITNNFGVDPNYRTPYVQIWNLNIQHEFGSLLVNVGYNGSKGTDLDIVTAPNRTATGLLLPNVQAFDYEVSQGSSILHAGTLRVRKRLSHGLSVGGTYVFSKSIDDASSIGGNSFVVAQNPLNLAAERGLSSFDQRHKFTGDFLYELPFGTGKRWLSSGGAKERILGDWTISGNFTIASGMPLTPYLGNSILDVARGSNGSLRPNLVPGQPIQLGNPGANEWFNTSAFCLPGSPSCLGPAGYGDAGRNIITGPGTVLFNLSMAKTFPFRETKSLEFRVTANNVFNHPNFTAVNTDMNSPLFGQLISAGSMRQLTFSSRLTF